MKRLRPFCVVVIALVLSVAWILSSPAGAQDQKQEKKVSLDQPVRLLFVTYSGGFRHGAVTRKGDKLSPAEVAMTDLGIKSGLFRADSTQDPAKDFTKNNLQNYQIVMFYTTGPRDKIRPWLWVLPALACLVIFWLYPVINTINLSLRNASSTQFVGLEIFL